MKCSLNIRNGSVKLNVNTPLAHFMNLQTMILKPVGYGGNIGIGRTIQPAELLCREPMMEVRRVGVILPFVERGQGGPPALCCV